MKETPNAESWRRVTELFNEALDLPPHEREALLEKIGIESAYLRKEVESLIASLSEADDFLEKPVIPTEMAGMDRLFRDQREFASGDIVDDFSILRLLGKGSFAHVYLARQQSLDREVAVKISANFGEEARTMAHLEHDNIVKVFSETVDSRADRRILCMQYVPGTTLEVLLHELGKLDPREINGAKFLEINDRLSTTPASFNPSALRDREVLATLDFVEAVSWFGTRLADALAYAHQRGVLHLDVKPGNVLVSPYGRPLLTDFNVALTPLAVENRSRQMIGGTAAYMAPEHQALFDPERGESALDKIDHRADIFSLGSLLQEMMDFRNSVPRPVSSFWEVRATERELHSTEEELRSVIRSCVEPAPERRFESADRLAKGLEACLERRQIAKAMPPPGRLTDFFRRHPLFGLTLVALVPQFFGSFVNISYNYSQIVSKLTHPQQRMFELLCGAYNGIVYPACAFILISALIPLRRWYRAAGEVIDRKPEEAAKIRRHALRFPFRVVWLTTLGWMPGSLFFPLGLHLLCGPIAPEIFAHFALSFTLSWLIALTYSFLLTQYFVLRVLYPELSIGCADLRKNAVDDLASRGLQWRVFHFMAGFVPLVGAVLIVLSGPGQFDNSQYRLFQGLVAFLIAAGMVGIVSAIVATHGLARTVFALTGNKN